MLLGLEQSAAAGIAMGLGLETRLHHGLRQDPAMLHGLAAALHSPPSCSHGPACKRGTGLLRCTSSRSTLQSCRTWAALQPWPHLVERVLFKISLSGAAGQVCSPCGALRRRLHERKWFVHRHAAGPTLCKVARWPRCARSAATSARLGCPGMPACVAAAGCPRLQLTLLATSASVRPYCRRYSAP